MDLFHTSVITLWRFREGEAPDEPKVCFILYWHIHGSAEASPSLALWFLEITHKWCDEFKPRQKNLWVNFGSGKFPSVWYKATSKLRKERNHYAFSEVTFALLFKLSTCIPFFSFLMVCFAVHHQFKRRWDAFVSPLSLFFFLLAIPWFCLFYPLIFL